MEDDAQLLCRYARDGSDPAFAELVRRHVDLVYSAALRQLGGDHHRAQEATQMTFAALARKAGSLLRHPVLPAWLYRTASYAAAALRRAETRRAGYEHRAAVETAAHAGATETDAVAWERLRPVLDDAMAELSERDRQAIILRYFANAEFSELGRRMGVSESGARMRVVRAVDKLRERLARRGVTSSATALGVVLGEQAVSAAPTGVVAAATAFAASAGGAAAAGGGAVGALHVLMATKIQIAAWAVAAATGVGIIVAQQRAEHRLTDRIAAFKAQAGDLASLRADNDQLESALKRNEYLQSQAQAVPALTKELAGLRAQFAAEMRAQTQKRPAPVRTPPHLESDGRAIYNSDQLDVQPQPLTQVRPQFPSEMRRAGKGGTVVVDFVVNAAGQVLNASVASSTATEFNASAVQAVSNWIFTPGQLKGQAVNAHLQVPIVYSLNNDDGSSGSGSPSDWYSAPSSAHGS